MTLEIGEEEKHEGQVEKGKIQTVCNKERSEIPDSRRTRRDSFAASGPGCDDVQYPFKGGKTTPVVSGWTPDGVDKARQFESYSPVNHSLVVVGEPLQRVGVY